LITAVGRAKINLRHRVFLRDRTGYHGVETLLMRISLADRIEIEQTQPGTGVSITVDGPFAAGVPQDETNLCCRAADAFFQEAFRRAARAPGIRIRLTKGVPHGSGLGGGSADAGAVLRCLAGRWARLTNRELVKIAGRIGSDVPFFCIDVPMALGWERGRRLLPLRPPPPRPGLLVCPRVHVSAREAYQELIRARPGANGEGPPDPGGASVLPGATRLATWESLQPLVRNDLTPPVAANYPEIADWLRRVEQTEPAVFGMTGSGSAVFALFKSVTARDTARGKLMEVGEGAEGTPDLLDFSAPE